jgi:hypothetical protein
MSMKKFIVLLLSLLAVSAWADEKIKVMYLGLPQVGPSVIHAQAFGKHFSEPTTFVSMKDCQAGLDYINKNTDIIYLLASTNAATSKKHNIDCQPKITPADIVYTSNQYFNLCRRPDNKKNILRDRFTIGAASVVPMMGIANDYNLQNGMSMIAVPLQSSTQVVTSVMNGDVDWGFIVQAIADPHVAAGKLECPYSTNPKADNYVGRKFQLAIPDYKLKWLMVAKTSDPTVKAAAAKAVLSKEHQEWLDQNRFDNIKTSGFEQTDLDKWNSDLDNVIKNYLQ